MIPMQFGRRERPLFGVYDPALPPRARRAVLVLNPGGWEYLRAHRSLRRLAHRLQQHGIDVLRFDYRGTGDSWGDVLDVKSVEDWIEDTEEAVSELSALAGVNRVSLIGLRLGSLLATEVARRRPRDIDRLVIWEPLTDVEEMRAQHVEGDIEPALAVPEPILSDLATLDFELPQRSRMRVLIAISGDRGLGLSASAALQERIVPGSPKCWVEDSNFGAGAVPSELIEEISVWCAS